MVTASRPGNVGPQLGRDVREQVARSMTALIDALPTAVETQLDGTLRSGSGLTMAQMSVAMEAAGAFKRLRDEWMGAVRRHWQETLHQPQGTTGASRSSIKLSDGLGLLDDEVVESKIIASRLGAAAMEAAGSEWNDLRLRMQRLERGNELSATDPLRPEVFALALVKGWSDVGLKRPMWDLVHSGVQSVLARHYKEVCSQANTLLARHGVEAELAIKMPARRADGGAAASREVARPPASASSHPAFLGPADERGYEGGFGAPSARAAAGGRAAWPQAPQAQRYRSHDMRAQAPASTTGLGAEHTGMTGWRDGVRPSTLARAAQETRMATGLSPMARVRQRAQGVLGQLKRFLADQVTDYGSGDIASGPSPALARALAEPNPAFAVTELMHRVGGTDTSPDMLPDIGAVARQLRERATELKAKAERPNEKAIIEIVALMFQAILAEERIAPGIRVWFARLQIPVLRLALAEPDFFASVDHPARQLIDRMGACALGFDGEQVEGDRLEREIKRIVQVIEQYPETGRRVYQLVLDEFKKFLGRSLTDGKPAGQAATLAQQVEQKEALAIQYTIELRRMLQGVPISEEVREFLFRIWSDVLAVAAVRHGPQGTETLRFKQAAADVIWAVSIKPERAERSRVVQQLPGLLHVLRDGMAALAIETELQDRHVKLINDAVMQAFVARGEGLEPGKVEELSRALAALEDVVTDDPEGDLWLDPGAIELMAGAEGAAVEVISEGGSLPAEAIVQWARQLDLGTWFTLDHHGALIQVQYVWRSARGQLHLLTGAADKSYLVQTQRLAAYLQAGLLVPIEDEALTVRATRDALAKLQAQPGDLLH